MEDCQEETMIVMEALIDKYLAEGDQEGIRKINEELETLGVHISTSELMKNQIHHLRSLQEEK